MSGLTPEKALIFRITHIANVPWILDHGLHCRSAVTFDPNYREIGNPDLIAKRKTREVPIPPGGVLSDYVPFYFTPYSPMLYNIKTGHGGVRQTPMAEIVFLVSSLHALVEHEIPFVFTDSHAYLQTAEYFGDLAKIRRIDWRLLQSRDFKRDPNDPGKFERYQAEALVYRHLPVAVLTGAICHGPSQETWLRAEMQNRKIGLKVAALPRWYF